MNVQSSLTTPTPSLNVIDLNPCRVTHSHPWVLFQFCTCHSLFKPLACLLASTLDTDIVLIAGEIHMGAKPVSALLSHESINTGHGGPVTR
jgi:hypothetical protein